MKANRDYRAPDLDPDSLQPTTPAAAYLGLHPSTLRRHAQRGSIPAVRMGSDWRFPARWLIYARTHGFSGGVSR